MNLKGFPSNPISEAVDVRRFRWRKPLDEEEEPGRVLWFTAGLPVPGTPPPPTPRPSPLVFDHI